ncbi:MAG: hypothetical protein ACFFD2_12470 [Promethearchaeota archaeon]
MNIEDYDKWQQWKNSGKDVQTSAIDFKFGRERLFERTLSKWKIQEKIRDLLKLLQGLRILIQMRIFFTKF